MLKKILPNFYIIDFCKKTDHSFSNKYDTKPTHILYRHCLIYY